MADEISRATNAAAASSGDASPAPTSAEGAARILEEHITHTPSHQAPLPTPVSAAPKQESAPPPKAGVTQGQEKRPPTQEPNISEKSEQGKESALKILSEAKLPERKETAAQTQSTQKEQKKFDTSIVGSVIHESDNPTQPPSQIPEKKKDPSDVVAVHTLKDDLQDVVHDKKLSLVRAVSLEEDRRARRAAPAEQAPASGQRSKRVAGIMFVSTLLVILGVGALYGVFFVMNQRENPPGSSPDTSILFSEQSVLLPLTGGVTELKQTLEAGRSNAGGTLGSITRIIPAMSTANENGEAQERAATFGEFMIALEANPPDDLVRALGDDFFFGIHTIDINAPLFVLSVVSYDRAFAGMLSWEDRMNADLSPPFSAVPSFTTDGNNLPIKRTYEDVVMRNYDVRALRDDTGTIRLYYSFPTKKILIISESPNSFVEILSRLQAARKL